MYNVQYNVLSKIIRKYESTFESTFVASYTCTSCSLLKSGYTYVIVRVLNNGVQVYVYNVVVQKSFGKFEPSPKVTR